MLKKNGPFGILMITCLLFSISITACQTTASFPKELEPVNVRLKWSHGAQFAGFYAAEQLGYYAEENLDVRLDPGGYTDDRAELLSSGEYDFVIMGALQTMLLGGDESPFLTTAVIYHYNPHVYFALAESGVVKPQDFVGKRVMYYPGEMVFPAMMSSLGIDLDQIETVSPEVGLQAFLDGEVDVWSGYLTSPIPELRIQGYELNIIHPADYGVHVYSDAIVTSKTLAANDPDLVERFVRASLRGWAYAVQNPEEAVEIVLKYNPEADVENETAAMLAQIPLVHTGDAHIGWMEAEIWQEMDTIMLEQGFIDKPMDLDKVYSMDFLNNIYGIDEE